MSGQPDEVTTYSYDAAGNRLTELIDGVGASYSYNALNELMSIEGAAPPEATYEWDAQDRLIGVTTGANAVSFGYDGLSRLSSVLVEASGTPVEDERYVWNGDRIALERNASGLVVRQFYGQGMSIAQGLQAGPYYYTRDHLGSIRELVDGVGAITARYAYSPFGIRTKVTGDVSSQYGFTGLLEQEDSLLAVARYRTYDPSIGRWLSRDSLEEFGGLNLYLYANADPVNLIDREGRMAGVAAAASAALPMAAAAAGMICLLSPECRKALRRFIDDVCRPIDRDEDTRRYEQCKLIDTTFDCVYECPISKQYKRIPRTGPPANDNDCPTTIPGERIW